MTPRPSSDQTWQPIDSQVALAVPTSAIATDALEVALRQLEVYGVDHRPGRHVETRYCYLAGTIEQRLEDLHSAFDTPDIITAWCLRGGRGHGQLLPGLDWGRLQATLPRSLIGFSDISMLLSTFRRHGLPAVHGSVATELGLSSLSIPRERQEWLVSLTSVSRSPAGIGHELPVQHPDGHEQHVEGALTGDNLAALACMANILGGLRVPAGLTLILEDAGEPHYRLERSFWQSLESVDARWLGVICLGSFTGCPYREVAHSLERIFGEYIVVIEMPLYHHLSSEHGAQNQVWPYGETAVLEGNWLY